MSERRQMPFYQDVDGYRLLGSFLPDAFTSFLRYKPMPGDFFVVTFPKCGTTWAQQIVSLIFDRGLPVSSYAELMQRSPYLELCGVEAAAMMKKPGAMKLHLPYHLTPKSSKAKYLYVARNPKDTVVSLYHYTRNGRFKFANGTFDDFFEIFINGLNDNGDYFDHVLSWYEHRNDPNVLFVYYEELKNDSPSTILKIAEFMGDEYASMLKNEPHIFSNVLKYSDISYMKCFNDGLDFFMNVSDEELNSLPSGLRHVIQIAKKSFAENEKFELVRQGVVGDWRRMFTVNQSRRLDEKIASKLMGTEMFDFWKNINCI